MNKKGFSEGGNYIIIAGLGISGLITASLLAKYDFSINVKWKVSHFKSAVKHLKRTGIKKATGGTNWEKYLAPRFQKIIFFPEIWSQKEREEWGVNWLKK